MSQCCENSMYLVPPNSRKKPFKLWQHCTTNACLLGCTLLLDAVTHTDLVRLT